MRTVTELLARGIREHRAGNFAVAQACYEQVLTADPRQLDAMHLLGVLAHQMGDHRRGAELIQRAIRGIDHIAAWHNSLGECWRALGQLDDAVAAYRRALALDPGCADAEANLGSVARTRGDFAVAANHYAQSLQLRPNDPANLANLGAALCDGDRPADALAPCRTATRLAPKLFEAWNTLGLTYWKLNRNREAVEALERAVTLLPTDAGAVVNLGSALHRLGRISEAINCLERGIRLDPSDPRAHANLGNLYRDLRQFERAEASYRCALQLRPDWADLWNNLGLVVLSRGELGQAEQFLKRALEINPTSAAAQNNLGRVFLDRGDPVRALECFRAACAVGSRPEVAGSNLAFALQLCSDISAADMLVEVRAWGDTVMAASGPDGGRLAARPRAGRRLRIGYVSADFRAHPVAYFLAALFEKRDRTMFEVFAYTNNVLEDEWTARLRQNVDHWRPVLGMSDHEMAQCVRADGIDILIDLAGHTAGHRLGVFARRPAPCQATYLGYPGSTGLSTVDFRISDSVVDPLPVSNSHYVEHVMALDRCAWCYTPPVSLEGSRRQTDARGEVTFGCFNAQAKVGVEMVAMWARVLQHVAEARLVLKGQAFNDPAFVEFMFGRFQAFGVPSRRLSLLPRRDTLEAHFRAYDQIDIALDTFPYHGTTTTCDALWMGVPVVTLAGDRHASRVGVSLLHAVGLDDLVAQTPDDYVALAAALARDGHRLRTLRDTLRSRMEASPLMDAGGFTRHFEAVLLRMSDIVTARYS